MRRRGIEGEGGGKRLVEKIRGRDEKEEDKER